VSPVLWFEYMTDETTNKQQARAISRKLSLGSFSLERKRSLSKIAHTPAAQVVNSALTGEQYIEGPVECFGERQQAQAISGEILMELILIIVLVLFLFGGGGYWGRRRGHW
jgi:hypothetical protein